jgi:hypothetical protein
MSIQLNFVCGTSIASAAISWFGFGPKGFSHVDAIMPDGMMLGARATRIGSVPAGVQLRKPGYLKWERQAVVTIPSTPQQEEAWQKWLMSKINSPYDEKAILGFLLDQSWSTPGDYICSALQTGALKEIGVLKRPTPVRDSQITPDSLFLMLTYGTGTGVITSTQNFEVKS